MNVVHEQRKSYAKQLVEEAILLEQNNAAQARLNYLEAAEVFLTLSYEDDVLAGRYVHAAELFAKRANELKNLKTTITPINTNIDDAPGRITFKDVIGLEDVKDQLRLLLIEPFKHPKVYQHYNKTLKGGIVMYGPPGCGKSLIAEAAANEAGLQFFHVKPSDILNKFVGETEKNLAELFGKAREQPSVIFFDEFEVLGGDRNTATEHTKEVISQLLTEMDGLGTKDQPIFCIAATNEPWNIDIALTREGRFGSTIFVPPPNKEARRGLFDYNFRKKPVDKIVFTELAEQTKNWGAADIKGVCEKAITAAIKDSIKTGNLRNITQEDALNAVKEIKSNTATWFKRAMEQLKLRHETDRFPEIMNYKPEQANVY